jgi:hypothetical protein
MSLINKIFLWLGIVSFGFILGWIVAKNTSFIKKQEDVKASVVVQNMEKVNMSELYTYKDYYSFDISPLRKEANLKVNAKVSAGFDIKKIKYVIDSSKRTVIFSNIPKAELLSIDHTLDYSDIDQGLFNSFTNEDYNHINTNAKEYIRITALNKGILKEAEAQKNEMLDMLKLVLMGMGYELVWSDTPKKLAQ